MEKVGREMVQAVRAMRNFVALLEEAAAACSLSPKPSRRPDMAGFRLQNRYWVGIFYDAPGVLCLHTLRVRIDRKRFEKLGKGELWERKWSPDGLAWRIQLDLESEEVGFFALTRVAQTECLEKFIRESVEAARQIEGAGPVNSSIAEPDDEDETDDNDI